MDVVGNFYYIGDFCNFLSMWIFCFNGIGLFMVFQGVDGKMESYIDVCVDGSFFMWVKVVSGFLRFF